jgi:hypothetical protein
MGESKAGGMQAIPLNVEREKRGSLVVLVLAERAHSEGARSTRALEDHPGYPSERYEIGKGVRGLLAVDPVKFFDDLVG